MSTTINTDQPQGGGFYTDWLKKECEAAQYLCLSRSTLRQKRVRGNGPLFIKLGRAVRYRTEDLDSWIQQNARQNTIYLGRAKTKAKEIKNQNIRSK